jgi:hypothetical protein
MNTYKVQGIPHAFVIGKDGQTAWHGHPLELEEHLIEAVEKVDLELFSIFLRMESDVKRVHQICIGTYALNV